MEPEILNVSPVVWFDLSPVLHKHMPPPCFIDNIPQSGDVNYGSGAQWGVTYQVYHSAWKPCRYDSVGRICDPTVEPDPVDVIGPAGPTDNMLF